MFKNDQEQSFPARVEATDHQISAQVCKAIWVDRKGDQDRISRKTCNDKATGLDMAKNPSRESYRDE
jgi:hypothetical protein